MLKVFYSLCVLLLLLIAPTFIPLGEKDPVEEVEIFLISNEIHIDLALPVRNEVLDWETFIDPKDFKSRPGEWIEIGWGDRQFYFDMPTWDKFTLRLGADALFWPDPAVMHVSYLEQHPTRYSSARKITMSRKRYAQLVEVLKQRFKTKDCKPILIPNKGYDSTDNFYEAEGSYSIIRTCNAWTSEVLSEVKLRHPLWSPTKYGLERIWD